MPQTACMESHAVPTTHLTSCPFHISVPRAEDGRNHFAIKVAAAIPRYCALASGLYQYFILYECVVMYGESM